MSHKTADDLLKEIREIEPNYQPIIPLRLNNNEVINTLSFSELKMIVPPKINNIIHPILPSQGIAFIYAGTGLGKTLFTLNLAWMMASGGSFLTYKSPNPVKVLYVDGEMPFNQLHQRLMQIQERQGEMDFEDNLHVITPDRILPYRVPMIDEDDGQFFYANVLEKNNFDVIIFDNLSMLSSIDENKSNEWKKIQDWLLYLRSIGKTIIIVHHSGKDRSGYRGTSRMLDCADTAISLQPVIEEKLESDNINIKKIKVSYSKARCFGGKDALPFEVSFENGFWSYQSAENSDLAMLLPYLQMGMSERAIVDELRRIHNRFISQPTLNRLKKKIIQLKLWEPPHK